MPETDWDHFQKCFAKALQSRRAQLRISQHVLAERTGFQRSYIADVERSARAITLKNARKLASSLEIELSTLIAEAERLQD